MYKNRNKDIKNKWITFFKYKIRRLAYLLLPLDKKTDLQKTAFGSAKGSVLTRKKQCFIRQEAVSCNYAYYA